MVMLYFLSSRNKSFFAKYKRQKWFITDIRENGDAVLSRIKNPIFLLYIPYKSVEYGKIKWI
jgi:hypothetical protein